MQHREVQKIEKDIMKFARKNIHSGIHFLRRALYNDRREQLWSIKAQRQLKQNV